MFFGVCVLFNNKRSTNAKTQIKVLWIDFVCSLTKHSHMEKITFNHTNKMVSVFYFIVVTSLGL